MYNYNTIRIICFGAIYLVAGFSYMYVIVSAHAEGI